jgi:hypothetical protein
MGPCVNVFRKCVRGICTCDGDACARQEGELIYPGAPLLRGTTGDDVGDDVGMRSVSIGRDRVSRPSSARSLRFSNLRPERARVL